MKNKKNKDPNALRSPKSFQFINLTSAIQLDEYDRDIIRTRAISDYHQRKRNNNSRSTAANVNEISKSAFSKFRLRPQSLELQRPSRPKESFVAPNTGLSVNTVNQSPHLSSQIIFQKDDFDNSTPDSNSWFQLYADDAASNRAEADDGNSLQIGVSRQAKNMISQDPVSGIDLLTVNVNPLISLPCRSSNRKHLLIHHYFNDRSLASLLMAGVRKSWLRTSLQDPAFFTSVLSHYAAHYNLSTKNGDPIEALELRIYAIKLVNERLSDTDRAISDGTIGAVACLVTYEANNGTLDAIRTHIGGLRRMIALRGGFNQGRFPLSLQRLIGWAELNAVNVLSTPPTIISSISRGLSLPSSSFTPSPKGLTPTRGYPDHSFDLSVSSKYIPDIFTDLRFLSSVLEEKHPFPTARLDGMWYSDKVYLVQRNLVYSALDPKLGPMDIACSIAGNIYVDSYLRDLAFHSRAVTVMVTKLKNFLVQNIPESLSGYNEDELNIIFWILVIGGISAAGKPERGWFVNRLRLVREYLRLGGLGSVGEVLRKILWTKEWINHLEEIWHEITDFSQ